MLILLNVRIKVFLKLLLFLEVLKVRTILFYVLQSLETLSNLIEAKPLHLNFLGPVSFILLVVLLSRVEVSFPFVKLVDEILLHCLRDLYV